MKVLVTGGAGYIGSVTTRLLQECGHDVLVLDNLSHGHRDAVPMSVKFIEGDVADLEKLVSPDEGIDAVIHLAAYIAAGESMKEPDLYWENNTIQTFQMLKALKKLGIKKLIFASTAAVYGNPVSTPIVEDDPKAPTNTYGMTKLAMDMAITSQVWAGDLAAASVRFFNVAGAYKGAGERHPVETHLIPVALQAAAGEREELLLFGTNYDTRDGTCVRDYIHVADLARAMILALDKLKYGSHAIYNLGNGNGYTNREVIEVVKKVTGSDFPVKEKSPREGDPAILVASSQLAIHELGWEPQRSSLEDMVSDAWQYYCARKA